MKIIFSCSHGTEVVWSLICLVEWMIIGPTAGKHIDYVTENGKISVLETVRKKDIHPKLDDILFTGNNPNVLSLSMLNCTKNKHVNPEPIVTCCSLLISRPCTRVTSWIPSRSCWMSSATRPRSPCPAPNTTSTRPARRARRSSSRKTSLTPPADQHSAVEALDQTQPDLTDAIHKYKVIHS